jgi:hypothetical protein
MRSLLCCGLMLLAATARAQVCNPECADQPAACCNIQSDTFLAEQCTGLTSDRVHFVVTNGTAWVDDREPATFGLPLGGTVTIGDTPETFEFTVGQAASSARFQVIDNSLPITVIGQCVGVKGVTYTNLPALVSVQGRALQILKAGSLYCKQAGQPDTLCLQVKGQVGGPFAAGGLCDPDRVEFVCGTVS